MSVVCLCLRVSHVLLLLFLLVFQSSDPQGQCLAAPQTPLPTYKQRYDEFKKLFKELPDTERLVVGESSLWVSP